MFRKVLVLLAVSFLVVSVSGCATARKQKDLEIQGLRNQISALEVQLQSKDQEISSLKDAVSRADEMKMTTKKAGTSKKIIGEAKSRPSVKQIQIALKNAGYNPGTTDGHMGKQTRDAIKAFQEANNLPSDGLVGKKTWDLLKGYLYKKVK